LSTKPRPQSRQKNNDPKGRTEVDYPVETPDLFQESLRAAIVDRYHRVARPHPRLEDQAAAFANTIIAQFRPGYVEAALRRTARFAAASKHHMQLEQARRREEEIARNRRKPPRRKLYDV
jgi:hypothetical protein